MLGGNYVDLQSGCRTTWETKKELSSVVDLYCPGYPLRMAPAVTSPIHWRYFGNHRRCQRRAGRGGDRHDSEYLDPGATFCGHRRPRELSGRLAWTGPLSPGGGSSRI